jgi:hypothetical protein
MTECTYPHHDQRPTHEPDRGLICHPGYLRLEQHIAELPALLGWLHANLPAGGPGGDGRGSSELKIPINAKIHDHIQHAIGTLISWCALIADERQLLGPRDTSPETACTFLNAHLDWASGQCWIGDMADELQDLTRTGHRLSPSQPVKHHLPAPCPSCDLLALSRTDGDAYVTCEACGRLWTEDEYKRLTVVASAGMKPERVRLHDRLEAADDGTNSRTGTT